MLICHQPPTNHYHGFKDIDRLAELLGLKMVIHGYHHVYYEDTLDNGIKLVGLGIMSNTRDIDDLGYYLLDTDEAF